MATVNVEVKQTELDEIESRMDRLAEKARLLRENLEASTRLAGHLDSPTAIAGELLVCGPPNWEYQVKSHAVANGDTDEARSILNGYGAAGWELAAWIQWGNNALPWAVFKRPAPR